MSISVTSRESSSASSSTKPDAASPASFKASVASSTQAPLTVHGNSIDTGRYVITGSTNYNRPTDGCAANDGMIKIFDKTNGSFVDVYGDPHLYTSNGDRANFQAHGLAIDLADGTQVQFKPTAETNGVAYVDAIAVSKGGQTVVQSGYHDAGGVTTGAVKQGAASAAQGFNDVSDTVLKVGGNGSLGTLVNTFGVELNSKTYEDSLDGMGGGVSEFGNMSGIKTVDAYANTLSRNAGKSDGPHAANEPQAAMAPATSKAAPAAAGSTANDGSLVSLLQQLIALLQKAPGAPSAPSAGAPQPQQPSTHKAPAASGTPAPAASSPPANNTIAGLLQQVIALLQKQLGAGTASPEEQALIGQLLPLLQQKLDGLQGQKAGGSSQEAAVLKQLIATLQPGAGQQNGTPGVAQPAAAKSYNPTYGISGDEIAAMLAAANGTGPEVRYADYHAPANAQT